MVNAGARSLAGTWTRQDMAWTVGLFAFFLAIVAWFEGVDFYNRHFFDHGLVVFLDNLARIGFLFILAWLIYVPGAAVAGAFLTGVNYATLSPLERGVLGFGIGVGLWHVLMLLLGLAGLYYRSVMIGLAAIVLLFSARQFCAVARAASRTLAERMVQLRRGDGIPQALAILFVVACALVLLLVRGLYPGGGGDYYTHYFPYYLEVLRNHDLSPNDVWYHYYYSKGYGLFFLGMLLTDPEAPALVTFCCVVFAAAAMAGFAHRLAPGSLWPAGMASLYLLYNVVADRSARDSGGGHFQKDHEQVSALVVLVAVALCMSQGSTGRRAWMAMATSSAVAIAMIAQPKGVIVGFFILLVGVWEMLRRRWMGVWLYGLAGSAVAITVAAIMVLSYLTTGLANDQALDMTLQFADIARLDRWGVLPQIVIVAWIRDNYLIDAVPWISMITETLPAFMRLEQFLVFLLGVIAVAVFLAARVMLTRRRGDALTAPPPSPADPVNAGRATCLLGGMIAVFAVISVVVGRGQPVSYERASTFFVPLLLLLGMAACTWVASYLPSRERRLVGVLTPVLLAIATVIQWSYADQWMQRAATVVGAGARFFVGVYSLADAYTRQEAGLRFGGINPRALAAWRQVEPGAAIWATNVDGYCMVPGCRVESVVSFKMSGQLDEIVTAPPERAKELLQAAKLNYFLIARDAILLDLLPYSKLFAPDTIGKYLGIKWTDGSAFLLTWIGPDTTPLTPAFYREYQALRDKPEMSWFRFSRLVNEHIGPSTAALRNKRWGDPFVFPWRVPPPDGTINVLEATYGGNCRSYKPKGFPNFFKPGNATAALREECAAKEQCSVRWDVDRFGDPVNGCHKELVVKYKCRLDAPPSTLTLAPEASGKTLAINCRDPT